MINYISISGYKSLLSVELNLKDLNILVGSNASGKSSVIQSLLLLRQSANIEGVVEDLHLSGVLYEAGTSKDVLNPESDYKLNIHISEGNSISEYNFIDHRNSDGAPSRILKSTSGAKMRCSITDISKRFSYLNAERIGPRVKHDLPPEDVNISGHVGMYGQYTSAVLARAKNNLLVEGWNDDVDLFMSMINTLDEISVTNEEAFRTGRLDLVSNEILNWIIPGSYFDAEENEQIDSASLRYMRDPTLTRSTVRATHIGFGLTYVLPIIVGALSVEKNSLIIVENPEAHLHPFSQSRVGAFLSLISATGRQVILETHSDHVLNGIRLCSAKGNFKNQDAKVFFFSKSRSTYNTTIEEIEIDDNGRLNKWPNGFFDQVEDDLSRL